MMIGLCVSMRERDRMMMVMIMMMTMMMNMIFTCNSYLEWEDGGRDSLRRYLGSFLFTVLNKTSIS